MQGQLPPRGGGGAVGAAFLAATAFGFAAAPAAGGQAGSGSPTQPAVLADAQGQAAAQLSAPAPDAVPRYRSALNDYRPYRGHEPLTPWREANDAVGRLGGHMGHLTPSPQGSER